MILAGPSAVGKSSVVRSLRAQMPNLIFSVSATTRAPRPGEQHGREYFFVSATAFDRMIADKELLEWADIYDGLQRSGTPAQPIERALQAGLPVLVEVDIVGAQQIKAARPEAVSVFLLPPSWEVLVARLIGRGTETSDEIDRRLATARTEIAQSDSFDITIVNDDLATVVAELRALFEF